jgi:hypothetical protein
VLDALGLMCRICLGTSFLTLFWLNTEKQVVFFIDLLGHAMVDMVSCQHVTVEAQV